jgi:hypothetical protein
MTTRQTLHDLIDELPDSLLDVAESRLAQLKAASDRGLDHLLASAPPEDEPLSADELTALSRWHAGERDSQLLSRSEAESLITDGTN